jgi:CubicO group peptidase (beta-lactamase class C family)
MSRRGKVLLGTVVVLTVLIGVGGWLFRPTAATATGYAARVLCGGHFVTGRAVEEVAVDLPSNPLVPLLRYDVDDAAGTLEASILGLYGTNAYFTPRLGCTLGEDLGLSAPEPVAAPAPDLPWPEGTQLGPVPDGVDTAAVEAAIDGAFAEDLDGAAKVTRAVAVVHQGRLIGERYADGLGPDSAIIGWSATKSVGNAMIGRLVHEGLLALDDDALLPSWEDDERAAITIDDLLHMASGLAFDETYDVGTDATEMLFTPGDASAFAASKPLEHEPGTYGYYSSGTSNILCDVAHRASGLGPEMPRELVFDPIGMSSALIEPDGTGDVICSSFLYATARDWARFGQWFLQDGVWGGERLLPEWWVEYSTTPSPVPLDGDGPYGAHWWLNRGADGQLRMPSVPADAYWASGFQGQQVVVVPSHDLVVVRLGATNDLEGIDWGLEPLLADVVAAVGG